MNKAKPAKRAGAGAAAKSKKRTAKVKAHEVAMTVTFRHVEPTEAIRTYAQRKFAHLGKFLKQDCEAHLILTVDKYRQMGEITVKSKHLSLSAQEETKDLYSVIDLLADKLGRQVKSHTGKAKVKRVRVPSTGEVLAAAEENAAERNSRRL